MHPLHVNALLEDQDIVEKPTMKFLADSILGFALGLSTSSTALPKPVTWQRCPQMTL